jgi:hypothetical protein
MRIIVAAFAGLVALAAVSAQATPTPNQENWRPLSRRCPSHWGTKPAATARTKPSGGIGGAIGGGSVRAQSMSWLRSADASMVWTLEVARIYLAVLGRAAAGWAVGFGMGYRRGVNDAMTGDIIRTDHRVNAE